MRKLHRWASLPLFIFLLMVAATGVVLQWQESLGPEEAERERLAGTASTATLDDGGSIAADVVRAIAGVRERLGEHVSVESVEVKIKADPPRVIVWAGAGFGDGGRLPAKVTVEAKSGTVLAVEAGQRETFIKRLHTGEVFGDAGAVMGMVWGTGLVLLVITGAWLYWKMYRGRASVVGWRRVVW